MDVTKLPPKPETTRTMNVEPNWQGMFRFAVQLVTDNMPKSAGQALVIEMLEYGQRLDSAFNLANAQEQEQQEQGQEKNDGIQV